MKVAENDTLCMSKGYKQTEVGLIPSDWKVKEFGNLTEKIVGGGTPSRSNKLYWGNEIPWVTVKDFATYNSYQTQEYITKHGLDNSSSNLIPKGIIITSTRMALGKAIIYDIDVSINQDLKAIFLKKSIDTKFFYYWFQFNSKYIEDLGSGSTVMGLSLPDLRKIKVKLPPTKAEQTAIATALSDADALISSLEKLIANKRNIKQGAMQKLLEPKEGWEVKRLGDYLDYIQPTEYLVTDTEYNDNNQTPVLTAGKTFILGYTNEEHGIFNNLPVIIFDDFTTAIKYVDFPFKAKSSAMKMLVPKHKSVNLRFIYELMLRIKYPLGDHKRHWIGEYRHLEIILPASSIEQNKIATILSDMDAEISALETKLEKYKKVKLGMMQELLTGKIRLV